MEQKRAGSIAPLLIALLLVGALAAGYLVPQWLQHRRAGNERQASTAMKALSSSEADFRANDRGGNGVQDFWTGDISGLYALGLIPREIAEADTAPLHPLVPQPIPYHGYYFRALQQDDSETPSAVYGQVTDRKSGEVHNVERFGFVAYPEEGWTSAKTFRIVNENNTVFHSPTGDPVPTAWPSDNQLKASWATID